MLPLKAGAARCAASPADSRSETGAIRSRKGAARCSRVLVVAQSRCEARGHHGGERLNRRCVLGAGPLFLPSVMVLPSAKASLAPPAVDRMWEAMGGGPGDLYFPEQFLGQWMVSSTLVSVETPLGDDFVPNKRVVDRARREDLNTMVSYRASFVSNADGKVVFDRKYNTAALLRFYMGDAVRFEDRITWDINNPNDIKISLPGGTIIDSRTTRRSQTTQEAESRTETSEFIRQMYDTSESAENKVKASQCFTKYKWRSREAAAGGPMIVATQVVSDYLTPSDGEEKMIQAMNKPVVVYTYRMSFSPV